APDTKYTATLTSAIKDLAGNPLAPFSWTFLTGPRATYVVTPAAGATGVPTTANVTATFSEAITGVSKYFTLKTSSGVAVPATVTYDAATRVATLHPTAPLLSGGSY